ncbi:hypothetical protein HMPREF1982_03755 [Clostridiales bacterium oral taxon 876 str. F0540]|nr:hypothetical protein HMPREF1982_03755 [Clostridiales bacterium oral taxon 876 str. F0540]
MLNVVVLDGQGGGLGKSIISKLRSEFFAEINIICLGTNSHAANSMLKAGGNLSYYGDDYIANYIVNNNMSCIIAPIGMLCPGGLNGEVTQKLAEVVFKKDCKKYIIPLKKHGFYIPGTANLEIKEILNEIIYDIKRCQELTS